MKLSFVFCVLLGGVLSVRSASVSSTVVAVTTPVTNTMYTTDNNYPTTTPYTLTPTTTPTTTQTVTCCFTTSTTTTTTTPSMSQMMCPEGWSVFQGRCYYFMSEDYTWPQAQAACAMQDSMLVSVHSAQEYGFLQQLTNSNGYDNAWLGGFYLQGDWLWLDGSWFYNFTWTVQMDPHSSYPCLILYSTQEWTNSQCDISAYPAICEKSSNVPSDVVCPDGWTGFQGRCYYYSTESASWFEADNNCAGLQASLVSVHSPQEYYFLYQQTSVNGFFYPSWLGGVYFDNQWMWLDGSWFYYGFSSQMFGDSSANSCLSTLNSNGWTNSNCNDYFNYFCVKEAL